MAMSFVSCRAFAKTASAAVTVSATVAYPCSVTLPASVTGNNSAKTDTVVQCASPAAEKPTVSRKLISVTAYGAPQINATAKEDISGQNQDEVLVFTVEY